MQGMLIAESLSDITVRASPIQRKPIGSAKSHIIAPAAAPNDQLSLSAMAESETADIIRRTQVDSLSPLEALNLLYELKKRLG